MFLSNTVMMIFVELCFPTLFPSLWWLNLVLPLYVVKQGICSKRFKIQPILDHSYIYNASPPLALVVLSPLV